jgi:hypothetical protein
LTARGEDHTIPAIMADSETPEPVDPLVQRWTALRTTARGFAEPAVRGEVRALAGRLVAARAELFQRIASLQADAPSDDDSAIGLLIEGHQCVVKACTTVLSEMTAALGHASIPS